MSTTTIRLTDELKALVAAAAKRAGTTAHGFMLEAITEKAHDAERYSDFHAEADARFDEFLVTGKAVPWEEMRDYLVRSISGEKPKRPVARKTNVDRR